MRYFVCDKKVPFATYESIRREANGERFNYRLLLGSSSEAYVKQGSLDKLKAGERSDEVFLKLPHWGDVRLNTYRHEISLTIVSESGRKVSETLYYLFPVANLKVKEVDGGRSGYKKHYFYSICFQPSENIVSKADLDNMVTALLQYNTIDELNNAPELKFWDTLTGGGL